jgi:hypothetical protein
MKTYYRIDSANKALTYGPYTLEEYIKLFGNQDFKDKAIAKEIWANFKRSEILRIFGV